MTSLEVGRVERRRIAVRGAVQGVGFRPFVYRLARELQLTGWVNNSPRGVTIEVEGAEASLDSFERRLVSQAPPRSMISDVAATRCSPEGERDFRIEASDHEGAAAALVLPDLATCPECAADILDPANRRYRYPFTNCTNCGPRFSIIDALPYDRASTSMREFVMCPQCRAEYEDPADRRFHAQPNACPACGPLLTAWAGPGAGVAVADDALRQAAKWLRDGKIVAVKGLGGFHLMADARDENAVRRLRARKGREARPLALMVPSLAAAQELCYVSEEEQHWLLSPEAPIVLLRRSGGSAQIAASVAPGNPYLGVMLAYTPLHHLLLADVGFPVVATSGNRSEEPICITDEDAFRRLTGIADAFLLHNRAIRRAVDDSVLRVDQRGPTLLRRSRGFAPLPVEVGSDLPPLIAAGGHLKTTVAFAAADSAFLSQHIGDLESEEAIAAYRRSIADLPALYGQVPHLVVRDLHPDYVSTREAERSGLPVLSVQHHYAHALSCMADNHLEPPVTAVVWDGTGFGTDGTIWGGEILHIGEHGFERVAHLRTFRLPGGDIAAREPRRSALGVLHEIIGPGIFDLPSCPTLEAFAPGDLEIVVRALQRGVNAPITSSAGRLFDAVASLIGISQRSSFEGQAAMALEFEVGECETERAYPVAIAKGVMDWEPAIRGVLDDLRSGCAASLISATFHNTLAQMALEAVLPLSPRNVVLSGGCFQNRYVLEQVTNRLEANGFHVHRHRQVPPNDGGLALGQAYAAARELRGKERQAYVSRNSR